MLETTGEWWNADTEAVIKQALQTGGGPNVSDAYTINGLPGPLYNCSAKGTNVSQNMCIRKLLDSSKTLNVQSSNDAFC